MRITSRFWSAVRKRDWGTAALDVVVVAVGILMALAVDEWRAEREAGQQESEILQRMHSETVQAISDYTTRQERRFENLDNLYNVRRLVLNVPPDDALSESGCLGLVYSRRISFADTRIPVVEELPATGALSVIQDAELRNAALAFINTRDRELVLLRFSGHLKMSAGLSCHAEAASSASWVAAFRTIRDIQFFNFHSASSIQTNPATHSTAKLPAWAL